MQQLVWLLLWLYIVSCKMCKWTYELVKYSMIGIERNSSSTPYILEVFPLYLAIGPARHGTARARVRHGPKGGGPARHAVPPGPCRG